jgi:hypothetical protein
MEQVSHIHFHRQRICQPLLHWISIGYEKNMATRYVFVFQSWSVLLLL